MQREQTNETIQKLKKKYVAYFEDTPIQKYAAMSINRDEDTLVRWKKNDPNFADAVQRAHAEWVRKKVIATRAEFALERVEKQIFSQSSVVRITRDREKDLSEEHKRKIRDDFTEFMRQRAQ